MDYALISMPDKEMGRFVRLPKSDGMENIMYLDDVIRYCLPMIFIGEGKATYEAYSFKFTKDAEMEMDNDLNSGVMQKVTKGVKSRKSGEPIRVIYDDSMPKELLKRIMSRLNIDTLDTIVSGGRYQNHKDLMAFPDCGRDDLKYPKWTPILKPELETEQSILDTIRQKDRFIHVPYHSFNSFIRVLREAALSPDVKAINVTLYRLAKASKVLMSSSLLPRYSSMWLKRSTAPRFMCPTSRLPTASLMGSLRNEELGMRNEECPCAANS